MFYATNIEENAEFNLNPFFWQDRPKGISAVIRIKDEDEWLSHSVDSIVEWCDEIMLCLQGKQSDNTEEIAKDLLKRHGTKVRILRYPFDSLPNGKGHGNQQRGSLYERAYFYNWCFTQSTYSHAMKWDGDMVAMDGIGRELTALIDGGNDIVRFFGIDIVGRSLNLVGEKARTAVEPRLFRVTPETYYVTGDLCEMFSLQQQPAIGLKHAAYLHFKWAKDISSAAKAWAPNWVEKVGSTKLKRSIPFAPYKGSLPKSIAKLQTERRTKADAPSSQTRDGFIRSLIDNVKPGFGVICGEYHEFPFKYAIRCGLSLRVRCRSQQVFVAATKEDYCPLSPISFNMQDNVQDVLAYNAEGETGVFVFHGHCPELSSPPAFIATFSHCVEDIPGYDRQRFEFDDGTSCELFKRA